MDRRLCKGAKRILNPYYFALVQNIGIHPKSDYATHMNYEMIIEPMITLNAWTKT
jgi:hypothetical protein